MSEEWSYKVARVYFGDKKGTFVEMSIPDNFGEYLYTTIVTKTQIEVEEHV